MSTAVVFRDTVEEIGGIETLKNPLTIVEVLSASTGAFDRGRKFDHYKTLSSLRGDLLLWQDRPRADHLLPPGRRQLGADDRRRTGCCNCLAQDRTGSVVGGPVREVDFPPVSDTFEPDLTPPDSHPAGSRIR